MKPEQRITQCRKPSSSWGRLGRFLCGRSRRLFIGSGYPSNRIFGLCRRAARRVAMASVAHSINPNRNHARPRNTLNSAFMASKILFSGPI